MISQEGENKIFWQWTLDERAAVDLGPTTSQMIGQLPGGERGLPKDIWLESIHPDDRQKVQRELSLAMSQGSHFHCDFRIVVPESQEVRYLSAYGWPSTESTTRRTKLAGLTIDVSGAKMTEQGLMQQALLQELLMELASTYINVPLETVDQTIEQSLGRFGRFVQADRCYLFDYDFARNICINTHEWCEEGIEPQIQNLQALSLLDQHDWVLAHTSGQTVYVPDVDKLPAGDPLKAVLYAQQIQSLIAVPLMDGDRCLGFAGFDSVRQKHSYSEVEKRLLTVFAHLLVNVRKRREAALERESLQAALMQAQKSESLGRLAAGIAHDFSNTLSVIMCCADLALKQVDPSSPVAEELNEIRGAAVRSVALTRKLLGFGRKQPVEPQLLDLNEIVNSMLSMLRRLLREDLSLIWKPSEAPLWTRVDPTQVDQILVNLVVNARDAVANDGTIEIETGLAEFTEKDLTHNDEALPGRYVRLSVNDDGIGIDPEQMSLLFEPYFTTKRVGEGTGLGLATIYGIVQQNRGFIQVASEPDRGTQVSIYLPCSEDLGKISDVADPEEIKHATQATILVVEDEPSILKITKKLLERLGYRVLAFSSPDDALAALREQNPTLSLLVTDIVLPGMSGVALAREARELKPELPTLFISGYSQETVQRENILEPQANFLQKPFTPSRLSTAVQAILGRSSAVVPAP